MGSVHCFPRVLSFSFSIYENLCETEIINKKNEALVKESLIKVGLFEKVSKLNRGIHSIISDEFDDDSTGFSKGEMQRLALAKAILKDGDIFIFDEPDSFLDKKYIEKLIEIIYSYRGDKIILIVSHNTKLIDIADKIIQI